MVGAREEFCSQITEAAWCSYGVESKGHLVDTRSSLASDREFLLEQVRKPARDGQHARIDAKGRMSKCKESGMPYLPAEAAAELATGWLVIVKQSPGPQVSAIPSGH